MQSATAARAHDSVLHTRRWLTPVGLVGACLLIGVLSAVQMYYTDLAEGEATTWAGTLGHQLLHWAVWGAFLPLIVRISRQVGRLPNVASQVAVQTLIGLAVAVLHSTVTFVIREAVLPGTLHGSFSLYVRGWLIFNLVTYGALVAGTLAVEHWRRGRAYELKAAQLDMELSRARLRALQMQLHPHFLFNTLNTVAMLVRTAEGPRALTMIAGLGDLLRQLLDDDAPHEVPLREELAFLNRYLDIERVRFHDRLSVRIDVQPEALDAHLPRLVLQPLVENAIRHGIEQRTGAGTLTIEAARSDGTLQVTIQDDGSGPASMLRTGVGLTNTRERLRHLYGAAGDLSLVSVPDGAIARITLPWHTQSLSENAG
jgi:two-component system, LytTR family, sensor kinase